MKSIKSMMMGGAILLGLAMCLTSCEGTLDDIFGEWSRPTGNNGNTKTTVAVKSVTLDQTTLTKAVGDDAVTLTATVDPTDASDKTVTWKSSDASIAAVDANGKVTFEAAGTATITATATNGTEDTADDKTATCEVTISAKKVNVESVKLDQPTLTATVGDAAVTLTATVTPDDATDKTVKWTSNNESVATVADGVVTFVAAGTATITATATNGTDDTADDKTATCEVTISAKKVNVESVTLSETTLDKKVGADAVTLKATVAPDDATDPTVTWKSSDVSVATVDENGKVTFVGGGTATITATATNGTADTSDDKEATCAVTVTAGIAYLTYTWNSGTSTLSGPTTAYATEYTKVINSSTNVTWSDGTYVVDDNVTITGKVTVSGNVNLIICDGKKLTVNGYITGSSFGVGILSIYTQSVGTTAGSFVTTCNNGNAIYYLNTLNIYGGDILASSSKSECGGIVKTQIDVYGGKLTTKNTISDGYGIYIDVNKSINLYGGELIAEGQGIGSSSTCGIVLNNASSCLTVYPGAKLYASNPTGNASHCAIKGKIKSGTPAVYFEFCDNGILWNLGISYLTATDAPNDKYARVGYE